MKRDNFSRTFDLDWIYNHISLINRDTEIINTLANDAHRVRRGGPVFDVEKENFLIKGG